MPGTYDFVFDTPTGAKPGAFTFRFWVNDTSPPSIRLLDRTVTIGRPIRLAVRDSGSGVDPQLAPREGRREVRPLHVRGTASLLAPDERPPSRPDRLVTVQASDYQETKNMEDVGPVLPNTRVLHTTVTLRR